MLIGKIIRAFKVFTVRNRNGYWCVVVDLGGFTQEVYSDDSVGDFIGEYVEIEYSSRLPIKNYDRWKFNFIDSIKKLDKLD